MNIFVKQALSGCAVLVITLIWSQRGGNLSKTKIRHMRKSRPGDSHGVHGWTTDIGLDTRTQGKPAKVDLLNRNHSFECRNSVHSFIKY